MKNIVCIVCLFFTIPGVCASSEIEIAGVDQSAIAQIVEFRVAPDYKASAAIVKLSNAESDTLLLLHTDTKTGKTSVIVDNPHIGITAGGGMYGTESSLAIAKNGALKVINQNMSVGKSRRKETMTIVYRDNQYLVAGIKTFYSDPDRSKDGAVPGEENCDYNLLTGKVIRDGKIFQVKAQVIDLNTLNEKTFYSLVCGGMSPFAKDYQ